jgi:hypothetical protein
MNSACIWLKIAQFAHDDQLTSHRQLAQRVLSAGFPVAERPFQVAYYLLYFVYDRYSMVAGVIRLFLMISTVRPEGGTTDLLDMSTTR